MLPGDLVEAGGDRSVRDWLADILVFLAATAIGLPALRDLWPDRGTAINALDVALGSGACLSLWARRSRPVAVALFATAVSAFSALALGAALIAIFNAAMRGRVRPLFAVAVAALVGSAVFPLLNPSAAPVLRQRFPGFMLTAIAFGWGLFLRARRGLIISLRERAEQLEADQKHNIEEARDAERKRIAREMHDVLAHRLSLLSVHAGALEFHPSAPANEIAEAARVIRTAASAALDELRQVVLVLREDSTTARESPQPSLARLPDLIEESRAAGMTIRTRIETPEPLPDTLGRTAYRIIQEGLTNARKHAPGAAVDLTITADGDEAMAVEVISRAHANSRSTPAQGGTGLIGLSERVALVGGSIEHGRNHDGDFVLRATFPRRP